MPAVGEPICLSEEILVKDVQAKYDLKYREKVVQEAVTIIRTKQDRNKRGSIV